MKKSQAFPSKYLAAPDLEQPIDVQIQGVGFETLQVPGQKPEEKTVVTFAGDTKSLILNVTNWNTIEAMHGPDSDAWVGKWVTAHADMCDFQGKRVPCIRIKPEAPRVFDPPPIEAAPLAESHPNA